jgi:hypothetical protein
VLDASIDEPLVELGGCAAAVAMINMINELISQVILREAVMSPPLCRAESQATCRRRKVS